MTTPAIAHISRHRGRGPAAMFAACSLAFALSAGAAAIDTSFGAGHGYVPVSAPEPQSDTVAAMVRLPDKNFVVLGRRMVGNRGVLLLQRYTSDAKQDMTFGDQGTLTVDIPGESLTPRQLYREEGGRLLVVSESNTSLHVQAFQPSGQIDPSFGAQGDLAFALSPLAPAGSSSFHLLSSGAKIAILQNAPGASLGLTVYRYRADDAIDPDFGTKGKLVLSNLGAGLSYQGVAAVLADDRIVLAAAGGDGVTTTLILLAKEGFPDPAFGTGGAVSPAALQGAAVTRIAPLVSNLFVVAAVAGSGNGRSATLTRFDPSGRLDTRFGTNGVLRVEPAGGGSATIRDVLEELDNNLVVTGSTPDGMLVARYLQRGAPEPAFNGGRGPLVIPEPTSGVTVGAASLSFDGAQLLHVGYGVAFGASAGSAAAPSRAFLVSTTDGVVDIDYASLGIVSLFGRKLPFGEFAQQVLPQDDGKLLVLSATGVSGGLLGTLSRFLPDGSVDAAFGTQGRNTFPLNGKCEWPLSMALQPDGRIVVLGTSFNTVDCDTSAMFGRRFDGNGQADSFSFIYSGVGALGRSAALAVQADGKSVVTGQDDRSLVVARFLIGGGSDTAFATGGRRLWQSNPGDNVKGGAVLIQPDQKIVVAGSMNGTSIVMLRHDATGAPDPGFGSGGVTISPVPGGGFLEVQALRWTPQGRLLVLVRQGVHPLLAQYTAAGALDPSFGSGGMLSLPLFIGGFQSAHFGLTVQPDGGIVVSGQSTNDANSQFALVRLSATGQPDGGFGTGGTLLWRPSTYFPASATGVASLNGGSLVAVGYGLPGAMLARIHVADTTAGVVEFYNTGLNHYFITAEVAEQAAIDAGAAGPGWSRTGLGFRAYTQALGVPAGQSPVCRFYGSNAIDPATGQRRGPNSHFYTAQAAECAAVQQDPGWVLEGIAFYTRLQEANGQCAAGTIPVFRVYNHRAAQNDSNHRYTTDFGTYQAMQGQGWAPEGIVFCTPPG